MIDKSGRRGTERRRVRGRKSEREKERERARERYVLETSIAHHPLCDIEFLHSLAFLRCAMQCSVYGCMRLGLDHGVSGTHVPARRNWGSTGQQAGMHGGIFGSRRI